MAQLFKNNSESTLAVAINSTDVVPMNIQVAAGQGDRFPLIATVGADYFDITLESAAGLVEIFRIKQRTTGSDVLVVDSRARESTTAQSWATSPATIVGLRLTAATVQSVLAHPAVTTAAHAASAISYAGSTNLSATNVEAALDELDSEKEVAGTAASAVAAHTGDTLDAHDASAISYINTGTALTATEVQGALTELDADLSSHLGDTVAAHAATAISNTPAGNIAATTVQAALNELDGEKASTASIASTKRTFTAQQTPKAGTLTDAASVTWDGDTNGQIVSLTLAGNRGMAAPTNIVQNTMYLLRVAQDATGSRTLSWDVAFKFGSAGAPALTTAPSKVDFISFVGGAGNTLECLGTRLNAV